MDFVLADLLTPDQLLEGDYIKVNDEIVYVENISDDANGDIYFISITNDFSETEIIEIAYNVKVELYVMQDSEE